MDATIDCGRGGTRGTKRNHRSRLRCVLRGRRALSDRSPVNGRERRLIARTEPQQRAPKRCVRRHRKIHRPRRPRDQHEQPARRVRTTVHLIVNSEERPQQAGEHFHVVRLCDRGVVGTERHAAACAQHNVLGGWECSPLTFCRGTRRFLRDGQHECDSFGHFERAIGGDLGKGQWFGHAVRSSTFVGRSFRCTGIVRGFQAERGKERPTSTGCGSHRGLLS